MKILFLFRIFKKPDFWPLSLVLFFGILASRHLFTAGYFNMHDDLQMMRLLELEKCFLDLQIPCRWVPDMGYGYGFPLFNFYPPLPYLVGMLVRVAGFSFIDTVKVLFIIAFTASGVTMYLFAKEFFGKMGGVVSGIFYIWAPYHSVDVWVRGAMNEAWALIFFPVIFLFSYKIITTSFKERKKIWLYVLFLALSWFGLFTSHNLMVMIVTPVFAVWCLFWLIKDKAWKNIYPLFIAGIFSLGLSAFFTIPVFLEQKLVHANTLVQGYFEYSAHFSTISQILFSRFWGYGPSVWMDADDKMSFQAGHVHWILSLFILILCIYRFVKKDKRAPFYFLFTIIFFSFFGWFAAFMTHSRSTPIWQALDPLKFVQFPWRFLALAIFAFSFVSGALFTLFSKKVAIPVGIFLVILLVVLNWNYFKPEHGKLGPLTDEEKFSGAAWDLQRTAGIYDYLPKSARENPRDGQNGVSEITEGEGEILNPKQGTNWARFDLDLSKDSEVRINIYQFPIWKTYIDGTEVENFVPKDEPWGRMYIKVPAGKHSILAKLENTPVRNISNTASLISWLLFVYFVIKLRGGSTRWSFGPNSRNKS